MSLLLRNREDGLYIDRGGTCVNQDQRLSGLVYHKSTQCTMTGNDPNSMKVDGYLTKENYSPELTSDLSESISINDIKWFTDESLSQTGKYMIRQGYVDGKALYIYSKRDQCDQPSSVMTEKDAIDYIKNIYDI